MHFRNSTRVKRFLRGHTELNHGPLDLQSNALPLSYTPSLLLKYIVTIVTMISYMMYCPKQMLFLHHKTFLINIIEMQMSILWQQVCKEVVTHTVKVIAIKKISKTPYKNDYTFLTNIVFDESLSTDIFWTTGSIFMIYVFWMQGLWGVLNLLTI